MFDCRYDLLSDDFDLFVDRYFDVLDDFYLHYLLLDDRNPYLLHYFFDPLHLDNPIHDPLDDLRHLNYLLDYSWHYYYLLYDLLHLHHLWHLYQFLDDLVHWHPDLLYPFDYLRYLNDRFHDHFHRFLDGYILEDWLLDFDKLCYLHQLLDYLLYLDYLNNFPFLGDDLLDILNSCYNLLLDDWHLNLPLYFFDNLVDERNDLLHCLFYFFQPVLVNYLLFDHFHFLDDWHFYSHLHDLLDYLCHFFDLLDGLDYGDDFLHDSFDDLRHLFDVIDYLSCRFVVHRIHNFLYDLFDLNNHRLFNNPFYDLLYNLLNLFDLFFHLLDKIFLLHDDFHFLYLWHNVVDYLFYDDWLLHLDDLLSNHLHLHDFRHLYSLLDDFLDDARHFDDLLLYLLHLNDLLDYLVYVFDYLDRHVHDLLHLFDLGIFNDLFDYFLDGDDSWHFNDSLHYFLHYFWHFHDLMAHLEHLQNIINRSISNLLVDHLHHRFIDLRSHSCFLLHLLKFSQQ